jgi:hypothetical protein
MLSILELQYAETPFEAQISQLGNLISLLELLPSSEERRAEVHGLGA